MLAAGDVAAFAAQAAELRAAGADGVVVLGTEDPAKIAALGRVLADTFPG